MSPAEAEYRAVINLRQKVLGVDHHGTLETGFDRECREACCSGFSFAGWEAWEPGAYRRGTSRLV